MDTRPRNKEQLELLACKPLHDVLLVWIVVFLGLLVSESVLPGFVSGYFSFTKMIFIFFAIAAAIAWLGGRNGLYFENARPKGARRNKSLIGLAILAFLLIANSLRGIGMMRVIAITLITMVIFFLFYKTFITGDEE